MVSVVLRGTTVDGLVMHVVIGLEPSLSLLRAHRRSRYEPRVRTARQQRRHRNISMSPVRTYLPRSESANQLMEPRPLRILTRCKWHYPHSAHSSFVRLEAECLGLFRSALGLALFPLMQPDSDDRSGETERRAEDRREPCRPETAAAVMSQ